MIDIFYLPLFVPMNKNVLINELNEITKREAIEERDSKEFQQKLEELSHFELDDNERHRLSIVSLEMNLNETKSQLERIDSKDYEQLIHTRGKLLKLYKIKEDLMDKQEDKLDARNHYVDELKLQKETINAYQKDNSLQIPISKKLGLTIQNIAKTTEVFMQEKDIVDKAKKIVQDTALGVSGAAALSLAVAGVVNVIGGLGLGQLGAAAVMVTSLPYIASTTAYIGLSSLVRNSITDSSFQQYRNTHTEEYQNMVKAFYESHQEEFNEIEALIKQKKETNNREEVMKLNEELIQKYETISSHTDIKGIKDNLELEIVGLLQEMKSICEDIKNEYEEELNNDKDYYVENNKRLMKLNMRLFAKENSIKQAIKQAGKQFGRSVEVILITKAILAAVAPNIFPLTKVSDIGVPILISAINSAIDIPTYSNKIKNKDTSFEKEETQEQKQRIEEILNIRPSLETGKALV